MNCLLSDNTSYVTLKPQLCTYVVVHVQSKLDDDIGTFPPCALEPEISPAAAGRPAAFQVLVGFVARQLHRHEVLQHDCGRAVGQVRGRQRLGPGHCTADGSGKKVVLLVYLTMKRDEGVKLIIPSSPSILVRLVRKQPGLFVGALAVSPLVVRAAHPEGQHPAQGVVRRAERHHAHHGDGTAATAAATATCGHGAEGGGQDAGQDGGAQRSALVVGWEEVRVFFFRPDLWPCCLFWPLFKGGSRGEEEKKVEGGEEEGCIGCRLDSSFLSVIKKERESAPGKT